MDLYSINRLVPICRKGRGQRNRLNYPKNVQFLDCKTPQVKRPKVFNRELEGKDFSELLKK